MPAYCERDATTQPPEDGVSPVGRAIFGCDFIARPRRSPAATPSSSLFVSLENRLGQMVTLFLAGPLDAAPENRAAHAYQGRAFFDGDLEIVAHAHGQLGQHRPIHTACHEPVPDRL